MPTLADLPQLLADLETQAHLHELRALNAVGPAHWEQREGWLAQDLPESPEVTVGLRKLLEAKDCFVRAALP